MAILDDYIHLNSQNVLKYSFFLSAADWPPCSTVHLWTLGGGVSYYSWTNGHVGRKLNTVQVSTLAIIFIVVQSFFF